MRVNPDPNNERNTMNWQLEHAGTSWTWRPAGEVATLRMAVAACRALNADGFAARIMRAGQVWFDDDEIRNLEERYPSLQL